MKKLEVNLKNLKDQNLVSGKPHENSTIRKLRSVPIEAPALPCQPSHHKFHQGQFFMRRATEPKFFPETHNRH
jgi:hypothetical protein